MICKGLKIGLPAKVKRGKKQVQWFKKYQTRMANTVQDLMG
jgi:hypothetical protein